MAEPERAPGLAELLVHGGREMCPQRGQGCSGEALGCWNSHRALRPPPSPTAAPQTGQSEHRTHPRVAALDPPAMSALSRAASLGAERTTGRCELHAPGAPSKCGRKGGLYCQGASSPPTGYVQGPCQVPSTTLVVASPPEPRFTG